MSSNPRIHNLVCQLSWHNPEAEILKASAELAKIEGDGIRFLIQKNPDKSTWINSANVLKSIGFPRITPHIPALLEWFQDLNWPGVDVVANIFKSGDKRSLLPFIEEAARKAITENDDMWVGGLKYLLKEIEIPLSALSDSDVAKNLGQNDYG